MKVLAAGLDSTTFAFMQRNGIAVEKSDVLDASELGDWISIGSYDAGVIDLERSNLGIYAARGLRAKKILTPLIGISKGSEERSWGDHRATFLENGGDDLLRGPVNPRELVASLHVVTRRSQGAVLDIVEYQTGDAKLKVNLTRRTAFVNDVGLHLTGKESLMLLLFAASPGRTFSKEQILQNMYTEGIDDEPEVKIIDVFVCKLRRKLSEMHPDAEKFIETVWGRGYRLPTQPELTTKAA